MKARGRQGQDSGGLEAHHPHPQAPASPTPSTCWMPRLGRPHPEAHGFPRPPRPGCPGPEGAQWLPRSLPCAPQAELWAAFPVPSPFPGRTPAKGAPGAPGLLIRTLCPPRRSLRGQRRWPTCNRGARSGHGAGDGAAAAVAAAAGGILVGRADLGRRVRCPSPTAAQSAPC